MDFDMQTIARIGLGGIIGLGIIMILRLVFYKFMIVLAVSLFVLFILEYFGVYALNWSSIAEWSDQNVVQQGSSVYWYFTDQELLPGIVLGLIVGWIATIRVSTA